MLTSPSGVSQQFTGYGFDISQLIDPDTGQVISGRMAHASISLGSFYELYPGSSLPVSISNARDKPWTVVFNDVNGLSYTFKVLKSSPDRSLGLIVLALELYL